MPPLLLPSLSRPPLLASAAASFVDVIPNGLDEFWLNNVPRHSDRAIKKDIKQVVYVGKFDKNKNLSGILSSVESARRADPNIVLILVCGSVSELNKLCKLKQPPSWVKVVQYIHDKNCLLALYRESAIFLMPSYHETFGLVYLEALSQGVPFIYTKGEGVDGYFDDESFAVAVGPNDINKISDSILLLLKLFPLGVPHDKLRPLISDFSWRLVAEKYHKLI